MIACGWCGKPTDPDARCVWCRHREPAKPWEQRGEDPPTFGATDGRPELDPEAVAARLRDGHARLRSEGRDVTVEALAEVLDVSPRTVRRWQQKAGMRPVSARPAH